MAATPPPSPAAIVVLTTVASPDDATALVAALLDERLVACGTCLPAARSLYRWQGARQEAAEVVILLKTTTERLDALERAFTRLHPYDVPELLALPVAAGAAPYLAWLASSVTPVPDAAP